MIRMGFRAGSEGRDVGRGKREAGSGSRHLFPFPSSRFPLPALALMVLASAAQGQAVLLQIRPHIGDTLRMHLSPTVEMTGTTPRARHDTSSLTASIEGFARAIADRYTSGGTLKQTLP